MKYFKYNKFLTTIVSVGMKPQFYIHIITVFKSIDKIILFIGLLACIFISCSKELERPNYYMRAQINDMDWSADRNYGVAQLDYDYTANAHYLSIWSQTENPLIDGIRYQISISVNLPVAKGVYFFNNNGSIMAANGGVSGAVNGWKRNGTEDYFIGHSINGHIDITSLSKDNVGGKFEFVAVIPKSSSLGGNDSIVIKNGEFLVPINLVSGKAWEGPK
ncbi:hypothetical protein [Xanthocytophaga flava]|uniref:hypothetical protein n=1 Tax=Xanthocytophaga flava TaxID=3048013 RepID=UPI0028D32280|nr:hypothetical protein [Xanthocytophaga flavus]MDJ1470278.1 hypothetical protein [Xanthocytophaga flavus]